MSVLQESKSPWRSALLAAYLGWKYRQRFAHVRVGGFSGWQDWLSSEAPYPLVLYGNHQTWWDGLLDFSLTRCFGMDNRLMMEAKNLRRLPYFQKVGVFGVELDSQRGRADGLLHAINLLEEPSMRRCLIMYPHGRLTTDWETPEFQPGLAAILRRAPRATALPVYHLLRFTDQEKPIVEMQIGKAVAEEASNQMLSDALEQTRKALISRLDPGSSKGIFYISGGPKS